MCFMQELIVAKNLGRHFGAIKAVDGVSFSVKKGDVLGFLGPNGAGKSTTMKMLTCFLTPSFGTALVGGEDILENPTKVKSLIGYLPENAPLYGENTVKEFLSFIGGIRKMKDQVLRDAIDRVVHLTSLSGVMNQRIETLSKGFRRRVGIAQSLLHDPQILILDEPTDGLDPNQKHEVRELIRRMSAEKSIILSTHILEEVDEVCNRVVIIARGKVVADDTPDELRKRSASFGSITVTFDGEASKVEQLLKTIPGVTNVQLSAPGCYTVYSKSGQSTLTQLVKVADQEKVSIKDLRLDSGQLDEVFRSITA